MRTRSLRLVALPAVMLAIAGCGSSSGGGSSAPGVTSTSITFGSHQPLTTKDSGLLVNL